jgi:hypothetical protein
MKLLRMTEVTRRMISQAKAIGGGAQQIAAMGPGRGHHDHARQRHQNREHRGRCALDQHARGLPQRRRPVHRQFCQIDPRADRGTCGQRDPGGGQDQAKLQIEPGRGDFGADQTRGGVQEIRDVVRVHRRNLVSGWIGNGI